MSVFRRQGQMSHAVEPVSDLALQPMAAFWAETCGWVPGTGHCRNRDCRQACLFEPQRAAEAQKIVRRRRSRRALTARRDTP